MTGNLVLNGEGVSYPLDSMSPYVTLIILECTAHDYGAEIARLGSRLERLVKLRKGLTREVLASTVPVGPQSDDSQPADLANWQEQGEGGLLYVERGQPSWMKYGSLEDVRHGIALWFTRGNLVAIRADGSLADSIQSWLDRPPRPPFARIQPNLLQDEFFQGEIKSLWLKGVHPRKNTMADSKQLSGPRLQDALNPLADASFAPSAGKASLALDPSEPETLTKVGCSPAKSTVWVRRAASFDECRAIASAVLAFVSDAIAKGPRQPSLPWLATRQADLNGVHSAFELVVATVDDVGATSDPDLLDAAGLLDGAELQVQGDPASADFRIEVGLHGRIGGVVSCSVSSRDGRVHLSFGLRGTPTDETLVTPVLEALRHSELLTVQYESGHAVSEGSVWTSNLGMSMFPGWVWQDFSGWTATAEKPASQPERIHAEIGERGDRSLFSWAAERFRDGYLTCDDGPGEVADFIHLAHDDTLSLIHIKSASSEHPGRGIAVQRYEAVVGQAMKNLIYLDRSGLVEALRRGHGFQPACWFDGKRLADRSEMLEYLEARSPRAPMRVIVIQPHVRKQAYDDAWSRPTARVRLLDTLLNSARGSVAGLGADLEVWGAM